MKNSLVKKKKKKRKLTKDLNRHFIEEDIQMSRQMQIS